MQTVTQRCCFPCRDCVRFLYSCGNQDNPVRLQPFHPSGDVCPLLDFTNYWPWRGEWMFKQRQESFIASYEPWYHVIDALGGRGGKGLIIKPRGLNNESVWPRGAAICHRESGVPLSPIVECGGRLMRALWFLRALCRGSSQKPLCPQPPPRRLSPTFTSHVTDKAAKWVGASWGKCPEEMM